MAVTLTRPAGREHYQFLSALNKTRVPAQREFTVSAYVDLRGQK